MPTSRELLPVVAVTRTETMRDDSAWVSAAKHHDEDGSWETTTPHPSREPRTETVHKTPTPLDRQMLPAASKVTSHLVVATGKKAHRCGPSPQNKSMNSRMSESGRPTSQRRDGSGHWTAAASLSPGPPNRGTEQDASAQWVPATSRRVGGGATHGGGGRKKPLGGNVVDHWHMLDTTAGVIGTSAEPACGNSVQATRLSYNGGARPLFDNNRLLHAVLELVWSTF